jgi:hypothetical protein
VHANNKQKLMMAALCIQLGHFLPLKLYLFNGRFRSLADLFDKFSRMSASGGKADIERPTGGHKKTQHMAGLSIFLVAGA